MCVPFFFPQNELAKAEANLLAFTDDQYLVPTNGKPLRGLIQDHVDAGVKMCSKVRYTSKYEGCYIPVCTYGLGTGIFGRVQSSFDIFDVPQ